MRTLLIDNHDSFTYNLHHLAAEVNGVPPTVIRNDDHRAWDRLDPASFDNLLVSPGPGRPERPADFGLSRRALDLGLPVLGVCLGHQGLCHHHGARVAHAPEPVHGRVTTVRHDGEDLFAGIPSPFRAVRYHSLAVDRLPDCLEATAYGPDGVLMAVRHRSLPQWGVQFHPESIASEHGHRLLANFRDLTAGRRAGHRAGHRRSAGPARQAPAATTVASPAPADPGHRIHVRTLDHVPDAEQAFTTLFRDDPQHFWLDSSLAADLSGFSFLGGAGPLSEYVTYDVTERAVRIEDRRGVRTVPGTLFDHLEARLAERRLPPVPGLGTEFNLGYVGYLGYELKADCGARAAHRSPLPDAALLFSDRMLVLDHERHRAHLLCLAAEGAGADAEGWLTAASAALSDAARDPAAMAEEPDPAPLPRMTPRHGDSDYLGLIDRTLAAIGDGETYEVCLTNTLSAPGRIDRLATYRRLRRACPAPYAALLGFPEAGVLSASPERFLRIDGSGRIESKPIKGTRRRGADHAEDARLAEELRTSEKDRSENLMIVDLVRNDLGRVCEVGSVHVPDLFAVETYATVHQLVSTVRGRLAPGRSAVDAVRAAFPGGSMTGAPKLRTMELIDELEGGARGVYSGALGYFALSGAADLSIVIRTLVAEPDRTTLGTGGAIVALSDPAEELAETRLKADRPASILVPEQPTRHSPRPTTRSIPVN
ncbi:aminodeoxychorismate synthase component I [Kitasatospora sp. NPDC056446]|uniref:aminodeoxychorismate synthase component I n=1 Tax=Kitasatospora sp. NPDC056446 TaxID=3345819 RepID=UPI00368B2E41